MASALERYMKKKAADKAVEDDGVRNLLRKESGAAVSEGEVERMKSIGPNIPKKKGAKKLDSDIPDEGTSPKLKMRGGVKGAGKKPSPDYLA